MKKGNKKGAALFLTMLIMSAVLAIAMGIAKLSLGEIKISRELPQSFAAYYAAEAGIEEGLYMDLIMTSPPGTFSQEINGYLSEGITYEVIFDGVSPARTIKSNGVYKQKSARAVELTY